MKKIFFCVSLALAGLMSSCVDKYEEVDAESKPEWLGSSIYTELQNPREEVGLQGTFKTYLRLIDDLDEAETLSRTGSKTVFPANDEAFERFFQKNDWGVGSYEELSVGQKKLLLYSSMLDNPLLLQLLPNVSNGTPEPQLGGALKHATNVSVIDSVTHWSGGEMPANNAYWQPFAATGIDLVTDATGPMMVHLTREYMLNNGITTDGDNSDFAILTGTTYPEGQQTAFIFNDQVVVPDVTCQNGYIHQMADVVVPPGNMAQLLRSKENTKYMSRILDYFAVPVSVPTTTNYYNAWARSQSPALPEKTLYALRYLSSRSYDSEAGKIGSNSRMNGLNVSNLLSYDPGWNQYYQKPAHETGGIDYPIMDMGAFFVPSDEAVVNYFVQKSPSEKGPGAYLMDIYANHKGADNTKDHLLENLDSLHSKNPQVLTAFVNNLLKASFVATVPSKFETVPNDAGEYMGLSVDLIEKKADGKYDISFANNGAVYVMKELLAPDEYQAVLAPASVYEDMRIMNWAVQDRTPSGDGATPNQWSLLVDYKYYLLSMSSNYAFFIPEDQAFDYYYLDPASLKHKAGASASAADRPEVLHFYYDDSNKNDRPYLKCNRHYLTDGAVDATPHPVSIGSVRSQLVDLLNYHTVVLPSEKTMKDGKEQFVPIGYDGNHYFKTKHGAEIYVENNTVGSEVKSGLQIADPTLFPGAKIKTIYPEKNGHAYRLDRVIQPTVESVYSVLENNNQFSDFMELCKGFMKRDRMRWAGISTDSPKDASGANDIGPSPCETYQIFIADYREGGNVTEDACLDYNVRMFSTYNYTLFAPDNAAMAIARNTFKVPTWDDVETLYAKWENVTGDETQAEKDDKDLARKYIDAISDFVRYHFLTNSVYADNSVPRTALKSMVSDEMGVAKEVSVVGSGNVLTLTDASGRTVTVNGTDPSKVVNRMARDYWLGIDDVVNKVITPAKRTDATAILTSSFCAVHQISEPLCGETDGSYAPAQ